VKYALFGLWTLISSCEWGDQEVEAWKIVSDAIDGQLPTATRAWLFSQLKELVRDRSLFATAAEHVLRACLVRLHSFCESDHSVEVQSECRRLSQHRTMRGMNPERKRLI
jgi:hypothetical protein